MTILRGIRLANPVFSAGCPGGALSLADTILSYNPIAYWPLSELVGIAAVNYGSLGVAANATFDGVTLNQIDAPGGTRAGLWDGADDSVLAHSAALAAAFGYAAGTILIWCKVAGAANWTDGAGRVAAIIGQNAIDRYQMGKSGADNQIEWYMSLGGTGESVTHTPISETGWYLSTHTWSNAGDAYKAYYNDAQTGLTQTGLGISSGVLDSDYCRLGAYAGAAYEWHGYLAHCAIYTSVLTQPQIATIYAAGGV